MLVKSLCVILPKNRATYVIQIQGILIICYLRQRSKQSASLLIKFKKPESPLCSKNSKCVLPGLPRITACVLDGREARPSRAAYTASWPPPCPGVRSGPVWHSFIIEIRMWGHLFLQGPTRCPCSRQSGGILGRNRKGCSLS